jgi:hypothetical protein
MDGIANFIMGAVSNPVVGLILLGVVLGLIFAGRK